MWETKYVVKSKYDGKDHIKLFSVIEENESLEIKCDSAYLEREILDFVMTKHYKRIVNYAKKHASILSKIFIEEMRGALGGIEVYTFNPIENDNRMVIFEEKSTGNIWKSPVKLQEWYILYQLNYLKSTFEDTETYSIKEIPYYSRQFQPYKAIKIKHFQIENGKLILDDKEYTFKAIDLEINLETPIVLCNTANGEVLGFVSGIGTDEDLKEYRKSVRTARFFDILKWVSNKNDKLYSLLDIDSEIEYYASLNRSGINSEYIKKTIDTMNLKKISKIINLSKEDFFNYIYDDFSVNDKQKEYINNNIEGILKYIMLKIFGTVDFFELLAKIKFRYEFYSLIDFTIEIKKFLKLNDSIYNIEIYGTTMKIGCQKIDIERLIRISATDLIKKYNIYLNDDQRKYIEKNLFVIKKYFSILLYDNMEIS